MPRRKTEAQEELKLGQVGDYWLSQRGNSPVWCRTWYDKTTRQTKKASLGTADLRTAQTSLVEWVKRNGVTFQATNPTNVRLLDVFRWYYTNHAQHLAASQVIQSSLGYWEAYFGDITVSTIKPGLIDEFTQAHIKMGHSLGYIDLILAHGRAALKRAERYELITQAPFIPSNETQEMKENRPPRGRPLSISELARLFRAKPPEHLRVFMLIMIQTLCRPGAAMHLERSQVNFTTGLIDLLPKGMKATKKRRPVVPMTPSLKRLLEEIEADTIENSPPNFKFTHYVSYLGSPVKRTLKVAFTTMVRNAGFDPQTECINPYSIRHTMARELRAMGVDSEELSVFLGHRPRGVSMTTGIYAPYSPDYLKRAVEVLELFMSRLKTEIEKQDADALRVATCAGTI